MRNIVIIIIFACFSACNSENKKAPNKSSAYKNYIAQIVAIDAIGELDDSSNNMYFENPKLKLIFLNPDKWIEFNQKIWRDKDIDINTKKLSAHLTQCLSHDRYLKVLSQAHEDFLAGNVDEKIIETLISPNPDWSTWLALNYRDKKIEITLKEIYNNASSSARIKTAVDAVLTGKGFEYINANNEGSWPRLTCAQNRP